MGSVEMVIPAVSVPHWVTLIPLNMVKASGRVFVLISEMINRGQKNWFQDHMALKIAMVPITGLAKGIMTQQ